MIFRKNRAFTLVEVLVVSLLTSIVILSSIKFYIAITSLQENLTRRLIAVNLAASELECLIDLSMKNFYDPRLLETDEGEVRESALAGYKLELPEGYLINYKVKDGDWPEDNIDDEDTGVIDYKEVVVSCSYGINLQVNFTAYLVNR